MVVSFSIWKAEEENTFCEFSLLLTYYAAEQTANYQDLQYIKLKGLNHSPFPRLRYSKKS